ncbi:hypothetical protein SAMN06295888_13613 [Desulfonatronum zhilinae]|nr:hypothetical protein SAMN06295888_13613 [Desulfonatronum zhilinae]
MKPGHFSVTVLLATLILAGCGSSPPDKAPGCSDGQVQELVLQVANEELRNGLLFNAILTELGTTPQVQGNPTYAQWDRRREESEEIARLLDLVDSQVEELSFRLDGIRTNSRDDGIRKTACGATLTSDAGMTHDIEYTAQYTEDGRVYVQVFGLD